MPEPAVARTVTEVLGETLHSPTSRLWCLSRGSKVLGCSGDVLVEDLVSGLEICAVSGRPIPIRGATRIQRKYQTGAGSRPTWPIRICANAIAAGVPRVDVVLLPDQEIAGAALGDIEPSAPVRAGDLVNGATILREEINAIDWFCIAIETEEAVMVNGLALPGEVPAEIAQPCHFMVNRSQKQSRCQFDLPSGAAHAALRRRLVERALLLGFTRVTDPDLHVAIGDHEISPEVDGRWCRFMLPFPATEVVLASRSCVPADLSAGADSRRLGVSVSKIRAGDQDIPLDDPNLQIGWHGVEKAWRWTAGMARLVLPVPTQSLDVEIAGTLSSGYPARRPDYNGCVAACTVSRISGWALWDWKPAVLDIFVNHERVGRSLCDKPHPGLRQNGHPTNAGFEFFFPRPITPSDMVSVSFLDGTQLNCSPSHPVSIDLQPLLPHQQKTSQIVIVLGMHRSGTSLSSSVLSSLGVDMSEDIEVKPGNERGHWERKELVQFHDRVLQLFDRDWYDSRHALGLPSHWWTEAPVRGIRDEMIAWLAERLRHVRFFGFKDPRTARLLPLWDEICSALDLDPCYVYCVRDPAQVAASLTARDGIEIRDTEYRWMVYNSHAVLGVGERATCIIPYEDWFSEKSKNVAKLASYLGIAWPPENLSLEKLLANVADPSLRHHEDSSSDKTSSLPSAGLYRQIVASAPLGHFTPETLDAAAAFTAFEDFVQPMLTAASAFREPSVKLPIAAPTEGRSGGDYSATQLRVADGIVTTISLYSKALREIIDGLRQPAHPDRDDGQPRPESRSALSDQAPPWQLDPDLLEAAKGTDLIPQMKIKQALLEQLGVEEGFAAYRQILNPPDTDDIRLMPVRSMLEIAPKGASTFIEFEKGGKPFTVAPPHVIGPGSHHSLNGVARSIFVACLADAHVRGRSAFIEFDNIALLDFQGDELSGLDDRLELDPAVFCTQGNGVWMAARRHDNCSVDIDEAFTLNGIHTYSFEHWLWEYLPKYIAASRFGALPPMPILIDSGMLPTHRQALELMLPEGIRIVEVAPFATISVRRLWFAPGQMFVPLHANISENITWRNSVPHPTRFAAIIREMVDRVTPAISIGDSSQKLFLSHRKMLRGRLVNQARIESIARSQGFRVVYSEDFGFIEQIRLVREANFIAAPNGPALVLCLFARPGTNLCILNHLYTIEIQVLAGVLMELGIRTNLFTGACVNAQDDRPELSDYEIDEVSFALNLSEWLDGVVL